MEDNIFKEYKILRFISSTGDVIGWFIAILTTGALAAVMISMASNDFAQKFYIAPLLADKLRVFVIISLFYAAAVGFRFFAQILSVIIRSMDDIAQVKFHLQEKLGDPHVEIKALKGELEEKLRYNKEYLEAMGESLVKAYVENSQSVKKLNANIRETNNRTLDDITKMIKGLHGDMLETQNRTSDILKILEDLLSIKPEIDQELEYEKPDEDYQAPAPDTSRPENAEESHEPDQEESDDFYTRRPEPPDEIIPKRTAPKADKKPKKDDDDDFLKSDNVIIY